MQSWFQETWAVNDAAGRMSLIIGALLFGAFIVGSVVTGVLLLWNDWQADGQLTWQSVLPLSLVCLFLGRFVAEGRNAR